MMHRLVKDMRRSLTRALLLACLAPAVAAASTELHLDRAPVNLQDLTSLQRGAQVFVNYCLNCHSAAYMRFNRLADIGLTEEQIRDNLVLTGAKVGETMTIAMKPKESAQWFGVTPPDLTVIARSRGADWLYTYLRTFYRDTSRASGWNNIAFPQVGMPHVLWELQGVQEYVEEPAKKEGGGHGEAAHPEKKLKLVEPGKLSKAEYDRLAADLVNYLVYMGEPMKAYRVQLGIIVLFFLAGLFVLAYLLKKEYWKDVH